MVKAYRKIYTILNGLFHVAWIFNTAFLSRRRGVCYFWLSLEFSLQSWLVGVSAFKADISFLFSICYINRVNSYRVPKSRRKQLTRLFLARQCNWQHVALSTPAVSVLKGSAVAPPPRHQGADNRQIWGNECCWEESRGEKPGGGRMKVIKEIINTSIVVFLHLYLTDSHTIPLRIYNYYLLLKILYTYLYICVF